MKIHPRVKKVNTAKLRFMTDYNKLSEDLGLPVQLQVEFLTALLVALANSSDFITNKQNNDLYLIYRKHMLDLTRIEKMQILTEVLSSSLKYELRYERHGNYEDSADLE